MSTLHIAGGVLEIDRIAPARAGLPVLVFLHQGLGSMGLWRDFPRRLAAASGCGAIVYSRRGHGHSSPLTTPRGDDYLHHEALVVLPEVLAAEGVTDLVLIGHSDGASIALIHAGDGRWPVRGLSAVAPHVLVEDVTVAGVRAARDIFMQTNMVERLARHHDDPRGIFLAWADTWLRPSFRSWNIEDHLSGIRCPTLLIQGVEDEYGTLDQLDRIERRVAGPVTRLDLCDCGHDPFRDQPVKMLQAHVAWLRTLMS